MTAGVVDQLPLVDALPVAHLFDMQVDLQPAQPISTPLGTRLTFVVNGGTITGPALTGEVLPGGGDWLLVGADGVGRVDVRVTLRSHDDVLVHFESAGIIKVPADGLQRLAAGQALPFGETYVRTTPRLATSDERYARLGEIVTVAYNVLAPNRVDYRVYQVL
jgi:hypothetical protein